MTWVAEAFPVREGSKGLGELSRSSFIPRGSSQLPSALVVESDGFRVHLLLHSIIRQVVVVHRRHPAINH
jgi:hypothetical protein